MRNYFNIENKKNFDGSRTAYDFSGRSWRIYGESGFWSARANITKQGSINVLIGYKTLSEISKELESIN